MIRRLAFGLVCLVVLAWAPAAFGAFPGPYALQGGLGVLSGDGAMRYTVSKDGTNTLLQAVRRDDGAVVMSKSIVGAFGITTLSPQGGYGEGLSHDGKTLVLQTVGLSPQTQFLLVDTSDLTTRDTISLKGTFAYDAMSPDGARLYLIQHKTVNDLNHYIVRGYDVEEHTLLPARIADKTQKNWVMQGWAVSRTSTANGRWVYTLYANPGGFPFVHALDTVRGVAHCVGIPWPQIDPDQTAVFNFTLGLKGSRLAVRRSDGTAYRFINTANWKLSKPTAR
jgi:hypothetical protein